MFEYGMRLGREVRTLRGLEKQGNCYLAAINCLRLIRPEYAWIVQPASGAVVWKLPILEFEDHLICLLLFFQNCYHNQVQRLMLIIPATLRRLEIRTIAVQVSPSKKLARSYIINWAWWCTTIIPAIWEDKVPGWHRQKHKLYPQQKGLAV
jgi:hypothetical protein